MQAIEEAATRTMKKIQEIERGFDLLLLEKIIDKQTYEMFSQAVFDSDYQVTEEIKHITKETDRLFSVYDFKYLNWDECDEIIFPSLDMNKDNDRKNGLASINLYTFKLSISDAPDEVLPCCQSCKVDKNIYFIHGGIYWSTLPIEYKVERYLEQNAYLIHIKEIY